MAVEITKVDDNGNVVEFTYDKYVHRGSLMQHRMALSPWDPDHTYNYLKANGIEHPEKFGIEHPVTAKYKDLTKEELISKLAELELSLHNAERDYEQKEMYQ